MGRLRKEVDRDTAGHQKLITKHSLQILLGLNWALLESGPQTLFCRYFIGFAICTRKRPIFITHDEDIQSPLVYDHQKMHTETSTERGFAYLLVHCKCTGIFAIFNIFSLFEAVLLA